MATKQILADDLEVGDHFIDITPGCERVEYVVSFKNQNSVEAHPATDKDGEELFMFHALEIVEVEVK